MTLIYPRIGLIDSGIGGFGVYEKLYAKLPFFDYVYVADLAYQPFGNKDPEALTARLIKIAEYLVDEKHIEYLVLPCNTASVTSLQALREVLKIPVVGTVPGIKTAGLRSRTRVVGVLATDLTAKSTYLAELIKEHSNGCRFHIHPASDLVPLAEEKLWTRGAKLSRTLERKVRAGSDLSELDLVQENSLFKAEQVRDIITPLLATPDIDSIVLGCTHFPHLLPEMRAADPEGRIDWINTDEAVAERLYSLVKADYEPKFETWKNAHSLWYNVLLVTGKLPVKMKEGWAFHFGHLNEFPAEAI